jgi:hypothetical protein
MQFTLLVLTASWISAAPGDAPPATTTTPPTPAALASADPNLEKVAPPTFGQRIRNFFFPSRAETTQRPEIPVLEPREVHTAGQTPANVYAPGHVSNSSPVSAAASITPTVKASATVQAPSVPAAPAQPVVTTTVKAMPPSFALSEKELKQVGHEQDYSWITGKLSHQPGQNGRWVLHYAGPYEEDRYGGTMVLHATGALANVHDGDLVCVHGRVLANSTGARASSGAIYEVQSANVIEHVAH